MYPGIQDVGRRLYSFHCCINAQTIHFGNDQKEIRRPLFLKQLSYELVLEELRRSCKTIGIPYALQQRLKKLKEDSAKQPDEESSLVESSNKNRRCLPCTAESGIRRLSIFECKHSKTVPCYNVNQKLHHIKL